eukprot:207144-Chlamydomonas_euryale.AAC.16
MSCSLVNTTNAQGNPTSPHTPTPPHSHLTLLLHMPTPYAYPSPPPYSTRPPQTLPSTHNSNDLLKDERLQFSPPPHPSPAIDGHLLKKERLLLSVSRSSAVFVRLPLWMRKMPSGELTKKGCRQQAAARQLLIKVRECG